MKLEGWCRRLATQSKEVERQEGISEVQYRLYDGGRNEQYSYLMGGENIVSTYC